MASRRAIWQRMDDVIRIVDLINQVLGLNYSCEPCRPHDLTSIVVLWRQVQEIFHSSASSVSSPVASHSALRSCGNTESVNSERRRSDAVDGSPILAAASTCCLETHSHVTVAWPISPGTYLAFTSAAKLHSRGGASGRTSVSGKSCPYGATNRSGCPHGSRNASLLVKIGRASCRERV